MTELLDTMYLLDAVSIRRMSATDLTSDFVALKCIVPEEIYYELTSRRKRKAIEPIKEKMNAKILRQIKHVLKNVDSKSKILDLYKNKGNGDIVLIATALNKKDVDPRLFETKWAIVTDDKGLKSMALKHNVDSISTDDFENVIHDS